VRANLSQLQRTEVFRIDISPQLNRQLSDQFHYRAGRYGGDECGGIFAVSKIWITLELENAIPVESDAPVNGSITPDNKFDLYTFTALAGDVVNVGVNNTSGTLDTVLYLIGPSGSLVAENDDAVAGENTNSLIANLTLPEDGQYINCHSLRWSVRHAQPALPTHLLTTQLIVSCS
jgi:hypothetical protein